MTEIHTATLIRLDITTNALAALLPAISAFIRDLPRENPPSGADLGLDLGVILRAAIANGEAALDIARGARFDVPPALRSQRLRLHTVEDVQNLLAITAQ